MPDSSAARCEIDLSAGTRSVPRSGPERVKAHVHARATGKPSWPTSSSVRRAGSSPATHSATTPSVMSGAGYSAMSVMLTPARPSSSASWATTPGPVGHRGPQLVERAAGQLGLEQRAAVAGRGLVPGHDALGIGRGQRLAHVAQARRSCRRAARPARRGWTCRCRAKSRLGAPATRVASRKLGPVAGRRSSPAARTWAAWATSTLASTWGRCETAARMRSCVSASIAAGRAPSPRSSAVQPLVEHARGARGRGQIPGRALEQVGPGMAHARRLGAGQRVAADEARVVVGGHDGPLGRAHVGDHAVRGRAGQGLRDHVGQLRPPDTATNTASASATACGRGVGGAISTRAGRPRPAASASEELS